MPTREFPVPLALALAMLLMAGCAQFPTRDHGPAYPVNVSQVPNAIPRYEPKSPYGNPSSYAVDGQTYRVLPSCVGYQKRGIASWYGSKFNAGRTSDGEIYNMYAMTAASKVLPLPCYVRVTNLENGRAVVVRVNDRGPFVENRIIDLSYAAAARIGMLDRGTALVEVTALTPGAPSASAAPGSGLPVAGAVDAQRAATGTLRKPQIFVQVDAFANRVNATRVLNRLRAANLGPAFILRDTRHGLLFYEVRIGPIPHVSQVDTLTSRLGTLGFPDAEVVIP